MTLAFRVLYRVYRVYAWFWRHVQRRLTPAGLALAGALAVTMVMGIDTEHNVEYQAFALLFFMLLIAVVFTCSFRARFSAERKLPRFGTVGVPVKYTVTLTNLSSRTQAGLTVLENMVAGPPSCTEWVSAQLHGNKGMRSFRFEQGNRVRLFAPMAVAEGRVPAVAPRQQADVTMELTPVRRGALHLNGLTVARADPLGLFRAFSRVKLPQTMLVLPRRYRLPPIALPGTMKYQEGGVAMASSVGQSEDFVALRDYRHGDPMRHIHWRTWARAGKPVVKEFEDEFFVRHALVLDTFSEPGEPFEEAVSVAASFACTVQTQESLLDLLFVGPESYCFTSGRGLAHSDQMLEILASVQVCHSKPFETLEALVLQHAQGVSGAICVLLSWDKPRQEFVRKLRMLNVPVLVFLIVPPGTGVPDPGPMRDAPQTFHVLACGDIEHALARLG